MRFPVVAFVFVLLCAAAQGAIAAVIGASYQAVAGTNSYAPLSKSAFYDAQTVSNVSPAMADVSDSWVGTNAGGSTTTWNWFGSAHLNITTASDAGGLAITGHASYSYDLETTADFVDPTRSTALLSPASGSDYRCTFTIDGSAGYSLHIQLNENSFVRLSSTVAGTFFQRSNISASPLTVDQSGSLIPGQYEIRVNTSLAVPQPLPDGINQINSNGGFENFAFRVSVPEPSTGLLCEAAALAAMRMRPRRN